MVVAIDVVNYKVFAQAKCQLSHVLGKIRLAKAGKTQEAQTNT